MKIAGEYTTDDWHKIRESLDTQDAGQWDTAIDILDKRIRTRFIEPIEKLQGGQYTGFAMMTLNCLLIDTIQSFKEGRVEHGSTGRAFTIFLKSKRFSSFNSDDRSEFFGCVRNGLFHDGETRKGWRLRKDTNQILTKEGTGKGKIKVLNRNLFAAAIREEFEEYVTELRDPANTDLRKNFLGRMDQICGKTKERIVYFAYGSNMSSNRLNDRVKKNIEERSGRRCRLPCYRLRFNKLSTKDHSGKANIEKSESHEVWGVLYYLDKSDFDKVEGYEGGYELLDVTVDCCGESVKAKAFIATEPGKKHIDVKKIYYKHICCGAKEYDLPIDYIDSISPNLVE